MFWVDLVAAALVLVGLFFTLTATVGVLRLPDVYTRIEAAAKGATVGVAAIVLGGTLHFSAVERAIRPKELLTVLFLVLTAPVSAHVIGRSAYLGGVPLSGRSVVDEWRRDRERETAAAAHPGGRAGAPASRGPGADQPGTGPP